MYTIYTKLKYKNSKNNDVREVRIPVGIQDDSFVGYKDTVNLDYIKRIYNSKTGKIIPLNGDQILLTDLDIYSKYKTIDSVVGCLPVTTLPVGESALEVNINNIINKLEENGIPLEYDTNFYRDVVTEEISKITGMPVGHNSPFLVRGKVLSELGLETYFDERFLVTEVEEKEVSVDGEVNKRKNDDDEDTEEILVENSYYKFNNKEVSHSNIFRYQLSGSREFLATYQGNVIDGLLEYFNKKEDVKEALAYTEIIKSDATLNALVTANVISPDEAVEIIDSITDMVMSLRAGELIEVSDDLTSIIESIENKGVTQSEEELINEYSSKGMGSTDVAELAFYSKVEEDKEKYEELRLSTEDPKITKQVMMEGTDELSIRIRSAYNIFKELKNIEESYTGNAKREGIALADYYEYLAEELEKYTPTTTSFAVIYPDKSYLDKESAMNLIKANGVESELLIGKDTSVTSEIFSNEKLVFEAIKGLIRDYTVKYAEDKYKQTFSFEEAYNKLIEDDSTLKELLVYLAVIFYGVYQINYGFNGRLTPYPYVEMYTQDAKLFTKNYSTVDDATAMSLCKFDSSIIKTGFSGWNIIDVIDLLNTIYKQKPSLIANLIVQVARFGERKPSYFQLDEVFILNNRLEIISDYNQLAERNKEIVELNKNVDKINSEDIIGSIKQVITMETFLNDQDYDMEVNPYDIDTFIPFLLVYENNDGDIRIIDIVSLVKSGKIITGFNDKIDDDGHVDFNVDAVINSILNCESSTYLDARQIIEACEFETHLYYTQAVQEFYGIDNNDKNNNFKKFIRSYCNGMFGDITVNPTLIVAAISRNINGYEISEESISMYGDLYNPQLLGEFDIVLIKIYARLVEYVTTTLSQVNLNSVEELKLYATTLTVDAIKNQGAKFDYLFSDDNNYKEVVLSQRANKEVIDVKPDTAIDVDYKILTSEDNQPVVSNNNSHVETNNLKAVSSFDKEIKKEEQTPVEEPKTVEEHREVRTISKPVTKTRTVTRTVSEYPTVEFGMEEGNIFIKFSHEPKKAYLDILGLNGFTTSDNKTFSGEANEVHAILADSLIKEFNNRDTSLKGTFFVNAISPIMDSVVLPEELDNNLIPDMVERTIEETETYTEMVEEVIEELVVKEPVVEEVKEFKIEENNIDSAIADKMANPFAKPQESNATNISLDVLGSQFTKAEEKEELSTILSKEKEELNNTIETKFEEINSVDVQSQGFVEEVQQDTETISELELRIKQLEEQLAVKERTIQELNDKVENFKEVPVVSDNSKSIKDSIFVNVLTGIPKEGSVLKLCKDNNGEILFGQISYSEDGKSIKRWYISKDIVKANIKINTTSAKAIWIESEDYPKQTSIAFKSGNTVNLHAILNLGEEAGKADLNMILIKALLAIHQPDVKLDIQVDDRLNLDLLTPDKLMSRDIAGTIAAKLLKSMYETFNSDTRKKVIAVLRKHSETLADKEGFNKAIDYIDSLTSFSDKSKEDLSFIFSSILC